MASTESFPLQDQHSSSSREGSEAKKKSRSIKLSRVPSRKQTKRRPKVRSDQHTIMSSSNVGTPSMSYAIDESYASSNFLKDTSSSAAKKENFQASSPNSESKIDNMDITCHSSRPNSAPAGPKSTRILSSTSSMKQTRTLIRMSSLKSKKPLVNKKMKNSRLVTTANLENLRSSTSTPHNPSPMSMSDTPRSYSKEGSCSDQMKAPVKGGDERSKNSNHSPGLKSVKVLSKTTSFRPVKISTKMVSLRSKKPSMRKCSDSSQIQDLGVNRATCSSTSKVSKFTKNAEDQPEGIESDEKSVMKVCPYTYCSLHGHQHGPAPPLKRFMSVRRRLLRSQKSMKPKSRPSLKTKNSSDVKKVIGANEMASIQDAAILETAKAPRHADTKSEGKSVDADDLATVTGNLSDKCNSATLDDIAMSTTANSKDFSASVCDVKEELTAGSEEKNKGPGKANRFRQGLPPLGDIKPSRITDVADETQMEKQKYMRMWRLINLNMLSGKVGSPNGKNQVDDDNISLRENISDQGMGMENQDASSRQKIELCQLEAIKLVEEAIDEILPEVQDQSSDDRSVTSDIDSDKDRQENNCGEGGQLSSSTSTDSANDNIREFDKIRVESGTIPDREEALHEADNTTTSEQKKTVQKLGSKPNQPLPKNWSKLKKIILFKRFMKALDKVRKLNMREPQYLPLEPHSEAERVNLKHQTLEERKSAEEWMLDYALRQVVSNLTPARRRKVELLVEAFETIIPVSEKGTRLRQQKNAAVSPHINPIQAYVGTLIQGGTEKEQENYRPNLDEVRVSNTLYSGTTLWVSPELKETSREYCRTGRDLEKPYVKATDTDGKDDKINASKLSNREEKSIFPETKPNFVDSSSSEQDVPRLYKTIKPNPDNIVSIHPEEVPVAEKVFEEVNEEIISSPEPGYPDSDCGKNGEDLRTHDSTAVIDLSSARTVSLNQDDFEESKTIMTAVYSASACDPLNDKTATIKENNRDSVPSYKLMQGCPGLEDAKPEGDAHVANKTQLEKQKYMKMWRVIFQHVVSGSAAQFGTQRHLDGADREEQVDDENTLDGADREEQVDDENTLDGAKSSDSLQELSGTDNSMGMKNHNARRKVNLSQIDAIKLVEEAIDEMVLPETPHQSTDNQSVTTERISGQDLLERSDGKGQVLNISASNNSADNTVRKFDQIKAKYGVVQDAEETQVKDDTISPEQEKMGLKVGSISNKQKSNSWSNLKKKILLKRFVKALENAKKFNPQEPRYLPLEPDPEEEKINLRHQTMDERKRSEEWMLDNAIQQAVARLTPARKRRVELLVEAFETVTPLSEIGISPKHNPTVSTYGMPIRA